MLTPGERAPIVQRMHPEGSDPQHHEEAPRPAAEDARAPHGARDVPDAWSSDLGEAFSSYKSNPYLSARNAALPGMLPPEARSVLDVGCGPGDSGRAIEATGRRVYSVDFSPAALRERPPHPIRARAGALPFADRSVDLVLSLELLEHLPPAALPHVAGELARVTRRWLMLGVPHRENLRRNLLECPACGYRFHRSGHLNWFDHDRLTALFPAFTPLQAKILGPPVRNYPRALLWLRHNVARRFSEMGGKGGVRCPRCGAAEFGPFHHNLLSFALDGTNKLVSRRRPYWLLVLFESSAR